MLINTREYIPNAIKYSGFDAVFIKADVIQYVNTYTIMDGLLRGSAGMSDATNTRYVMTGQRKTKEIQLRRQLATVSDFSLLSS